jgi:hypothetical protein
METVVIIVCKIDPAEPDGVDNTYPIVTMPGRDVGADVIDNVGIGNPYYTFLPSSIPFNYGTSINANFTGAPVVDSDPAVNNANIIAMLETPPLDKISAT